MTRAFFSFHAARRWRQPRAAPRHAGKGDIVNAYIFWGVVILVCFYLGARLTFQTREKKKNMLRINFEKAKQREAKKRA